MRIDNLSTQGSGVLRRIMVVWRWISRDGVRLAYRDFGGDGVSVLFLHGLAGHADEWSQTASWLTTRCRVVAVDTRGHGHSERFPREVSRGSLVADAAAVIERLGLQPSVVVGQSVGGLTALSLAARRPELVRGLVLADASPAGGEEVEAEVNATAKALQEWPIPFGSLTEAKEFFARRFGDGLAAEAWTKSLERRRGSWWPRFDIEVVARLLREAMSVSSWEEWESISCPTLVVRAGNGVVEPANAQQMIERLPEAQMIEIAGAAHDVHLDRPDEWREALSGFLDRLENQT